MTQHRVEEYLGQTVSHGTLRDIDLYNAFIAVYADLDPNAAQAFIHSYHTEVGKLLTSVLGEVQFSPDEQETISGMIAELQDKLDDLAPDGYHFGTVEGDASDFGFWQDDDGPDSAPEPASSKGPSVEELVEWDAGQRRYQDLN